MTDSTKLWVADVCTLPTADRPVRVAEFDALFARGLTAQERVSPTVLRWMLDPGVELTARDLTAREGACCSFFSFEFTAGADAVQLEVTVPPARVEVLDALAVRAAGVQVSS
jgi:hypothetical protein